MPGEQEQDPKSGHAIARIFHEPKQRQHVFDVSRFQKLQAAEFDERNVAPRQLDLELSAVMRGAEQNGLRFQGVAAFAVFKHLLDHIARLLALVANRDQRRALAARRSDQQFLVKRSAANPITALAAARIRYVDR